jgi:oligoendopeptidase F
MDKTVESLDISALPAYQKRRFVPENFDFYSASAVVGLYEILRDRAVTTADEVEAWIMDRSEMEAAFDQAGSVLYIRMTCQTDNPEYASAYTKFIEEIVPAVRPIEDQLNQKYLLLRQQFVVDTKKYEVYDRSLKNDVELFRKENVSLSRDVSLLSQEYQTICGAITVQFQGQELTLPQVAKFLQEPDRDLREAAWRATAERRYHEKDKLNSLFDRMLKLRHEIALNAGCRNFTEYQFRNYHRFDYTPDDCKKYHVAVEEIVVPVCEKITARRKQQMGVDRLRPWDTQVDSLNRPALKPFTQVPELIGGVQNIFTKINPDLGREFAEMASANLLDLASRKGKAPGGYQNTLAEIRKPFIFMNAVGVDDDVRTLLHEGGHAFHAFAAAGQPIYPYRHAPMEFCEVASMSMELLANDYLDEFYNNEDRTRSYYSHLEDVIQLLAWVATVDCFQHWIYENPKHTAAERERKWIEVYGRFGGKFLDWGGLENFEAVLWHRQLHVFEVPFYYIEYGIAQLGALQIWLNSKKDQAKAVRDYRHGLSMGGSRPLPELFAAAGLKFDFSAETIGPLVKAAQTELAL